LFNSSLGDKMKQIVWLGCVLVSAACTSDPESTTKFGDTAMVYGQQIKTFAVVQGTTVERVGLIIPKAAGASAMAQPGGTIDGWGPLAYPPEVKASTVLDHATLDFYRDGISAPWSQAFFGAHAFMIDAATQTGVKCPATASPTAAEVPGKYMVLGQGTFPNGGCIAGEGLHAVDAAAPEMQTPPQPFTANMWIGYSPTDGHWTFFESFITAAFVSTGAAYDEDVRVPSKYPASASGKLFPGKFHIALDSGNNWNIYFDSFVKIP
jgi:hypothetical protein